MKKLPDHIRPDVNVLFVGINPGIRSAEVGHHYAGYSNRFWKLLYDAEFVPLPLTYEDDWRLPEWGFGLTNIVSRVTPGIQTLTKDDYRKGKRQLVDKIRRYRPQIVALLGVTMYAVLFPPIQQHSTVRRQRLPKGRVGLIPQVLEGANVFVLPNPSGRNAHYSYREMVKVFKELHSFLRTTSSNMVHQNDSR